MVVVRTQRQFVVSTLPQQWRVIGLPETVWHHCPVSTHKLAYQMIILIIMYTGFMYCTSIIDIDIKHQMNKVDDVQFLDMNFVLYGAP